MTEQMTNNGCNSEITTKGTLIWLSVMAGLIILVGIVPVMFWVSYEIEKATGFPGLITLFGLTCLLGIVSWFFLGKKDGSESSG